MVGILLLFGERCGVWGQCPLLPVAIFLRDTGKGFVCFGWFLVGRPAMMHLDVKIFNDQLLTLAQQRSELMQLLQEDPENTSLRPLLPQMDKSMAQLKAYLADPELQKASQVPKVATKAAPAVPVVPTVIKFNSPSEAGGKLGKFVVPDWVSPTPTPLKLQVRKAKAAVDQLNLSMRTCYIFGKVPALTDVVLDHGSISRQHAVIIHGKPADLATQPGTACLMDLGSANGTFVGSSPTNMKKATPMKPYPLTNGMGIRFGQSSRFYVVRGVKAQAPEESEDAPVAKKAKGGETESA
jgi:hypothetical protein